MALCKIAVTPLLTHWSYCSLALSHRHDVMGEQWTYIATATMIPVMAFPNTGNLIFVHKIFLSTLQWRHDEPYGVSKRRRIDCLLNYFFLVHIKENTKDPPHWPLWGNPPISGGFPSQRTSNAANLMTSSSTTTKPSILRITGVLCVFIQKSACLPGSGI